MGIWNNRAFCPGCGGKIHTQGNGIGVLVPGASGPLTQTGTECQHCGLALSGKVGLNGKAISAEQAEDRQAARTEARQERQQARTEARQGKTDLDQQLLELLAEGPVTFEDAAARLGVSRSQINNAQARLVTQVKAHGLGNKRAMHLRHPGSDAR